MKHLETFNLEFTLDKPEVMTEDNILVFFVDQAKVMLSFIDQLEVLFNQIRDRVNKIGPKIQIKTTTQSDDDTMQHLETFNIKFTSNKPKVVAEEDILISFVDQLEDLLEQISERVTEMGHKIQIKITTQSGDYTYQS